MVSGGSVRGRQVWAPRSTPCRSWELAAIAAGAGAAIVMLAESKGGVSLAMAAWYGRVLAILGWIDLRWRVTPNRLVLPAILIALADASLHGDQVFVAALVGGVFAAAPFALLFLMFPPPAIGAGDVKMAALVGAIAGMPGMFGPLLLGTLAAALLGGILRLTRAKGGRPMMPYGPFLALGGLAALL